MIFPPSLATGFIIKTIMNDSLHAHLGAPSPKDESPRSHNYYAEAEDFASMQEDNETDQEIRNTAIGATNNQEDDDPDGLHLAAYDMPERPFSEVQKQQGGRVHNCDPMLLDNLRKAVSQSCFDQDLSLSTPLTKVPFFTVLNATYGQASEVAYDGSLNEKSLVYELAKELIQLNENTTLADFIEEVSAQICDEESKYLMELNNFN